MLNQHSLPIIPVGRLRNHQSMDGHVTVLAYLIKPFVIRNPSAKVIGLTNI